MSEIKTPLIKLEEGQTYIAGEQDFVITDDHIFADIIRFLIDQGCTIEEMEILCEEYQLEKGYFAHFPLDALVRRTYWAVYLYGSPEPTKVFKSEMKANVWANERDSAPRIEKCVVEAKKYT